MIEGARRARSLDTNQLMLLLVALVVLIAPYTLLHPHHPVSYTHLTLPTILLV